MFLRNFSLSLGEGSPVLCRCYLEGEKLHGSGLRVPKTLHHWICCQGGEQEPSPCYLVTQTLGCILSQHKNVKSECPVFSPVEFCDPVWSPRQWHGRDHCFCWLCRIALCLLSKALCHFQLHTRGCCMLGVNSAQGQRVSFPGSSLAASLSLYLGLQC